MKRYSLAVVLVASFMKISCGSESVSEMSSGADNCWEGIYNNILDDLEKKSFVIGINSHLDVKKSFALKDGRGNKIELKEGSTIKLAFDGREIRPVTIYQGGIDVAVIDDIRNRMQNGHGIIEVKEKDYLLTYCPIPSE